MNDFRYFCFSNMLCYSNHRHPKPCNNTPLPLLHSLGFLYSSLYSALIFVKSLLSKALSIKNKKLCSNLL